MYLDGDGVVGSGSKTVCPCERATHVLRITTRDGDTLERTLSVDVKGSCETPAATEVDFRVSAPALNAGECTSLVWRVTGAKAVFLDDEPVVGQGKRQVCPCEPATYTLTVIYPDDSSRDFSAHVKVSGTCRELTPTGPLRLLAPFGPDQADLHLPEARRRKRSTDSGVAPRHAFAVRRGGICRVVEYSLPEVSESAAFPRMAHPASSSGLIWAGQPGLPRQVEDDTDQQNQHGHAAQKLLRHTEAAGHADHRGEPDWVA